MDEIDLLAENVARQPGDTDQRLLLSRALARAGRDDEARSVLTEGLEVSPNEPRLLLELCAHFRRKGQFEAAHEMLATVEEHHPSDPRLRRARAALLEAGGDLDGAERVYAEDVQAFPRNIERRLIWTRCLMRLGRQGEAIAAVSEGLKQAPKSADLLARQTLLFLQATRFAEAGASLVLLQKYHPGHVQLPQFRARFAEATGDLVLAESVLAADAAANPDDAMRRVRWANCLRKSGQIAKAIEILANQTSPTGTERKLHIECLLESGRWEEASLLLDAWPEPAELTEWLAKKRLHMRLSILRFDHDTAFKHAREMLDRAPDDIAAGVGFTRTAAAVFQPELAWKVLVNVPRKAPDGGPPRRGAGALRSLVGQIVNELRLRPREAAKLAQAAKLGNGKLVERAAAQVRADPQYFGSALGLLIGLAQAGRLQDASSFPVSRANVKIPAILHQFWDRDDPPADVERLMAQARRANPYLAYRRWNDTTAKRFLSTLDRPEILRAYKVARHVATKADIFRLAILLAEGGIYLDADDYCAASLRRLLPPEAELVCYQDEFGSIGNNFLAASAGHPIIEAALNEAVDAVLGGAAELLWLISGPGLMTRMIASSIATTRRLRPGEDLVILPLQVFHQTIHAHRRVSYKLDKRHWIRAA